MLGRSPCKQIANAAPIRGSKSCGEEQERRDFVAISAAKTAHEQSECVKIIRAELVSPLVHAMSFVEDNIFKSFIRFHASAKDIKERRIAQTLWRHVKHDDPMIEHPLKHLSQLEAGPVAVQIVN